MAVENDIESQIDRLTPEQRLELSWRLSDFGREIGDPSFKVISMDDLRALTQKAVRQIGSIENPDWQKAVALFYGVDPEQIGTIKTQHKIAQELDKNDATIHKKRKRGLALLRKNQVCKETLVNLASDQV
jgi:hypothetical protein